MKIGVNLIQYTDYQGIEIFTKNILAALSLSKNDEIILFANQKSAKIFKDLEPRFKMIVHNFSRLNSFALILYQQISLPGKLRREKIDLLFCPSLAMPLFFRRKKVIIHDLSILRFPKESRFFGRLYLRLAILSAKNLSSGLAAVSNFAKEEMVSLLKIKPETIMVIGEGLPKLPAPAMATEIPERNESALVSVISDKKYFLYIGNIRLRKNLPRLLAAFRIFSASNPDWRLVIAGKRDKNCLTLEKKVLNTDLRSKVIFTGFVSDEEKVKLIKSAVALILISLYEGFGLPILEAQSLGTPVLAAAAAALPATAGKDGALFADPLNIKDIASKMSDLAENENQRTKLSAAGQENIKRYSWENSATILKKFLKLKPNHENSPNQ